ncbi:17-beta-hydroxysteroid dehydrogenase 13-like [Uranotaenia lowii]|uniref:17-beta-hydroxysteroid dehydrogenase 13-like n=1 Tax=Uranotaenia lowii TaxID=190385 RepID=UPI0024788C63|nr:17-beta-hydroxysteroid dehydrogenase 13-like [Uranotaenia lowii]
MEAYLKHEDGKYNAADPTDPSSFSRIKFIIKVTLHLVWNIPALLGDILSAILWTPKKSIRGQIALVTGGGNGLGRAISFRLAKEGCRVAVADIDLISARNTAEELCKTGVQCAAFHVDVSKKDSIRQLRTEIEKSMGEVDILVNNAGLLALASSSEGTDEEVQRIIDVNLTSHFWTVREFKPSMVRRKRGHIVAVCSVLGLLAVFRGIGYCATKHGVRGFMRTLREELVFLNLDKHIHTTTVFPTFISTRKELMDIVYDMLGICLKTVTPEQAARAIVAALQKNQHEKRIIPFPDNYFIRIQSFLPARVMRIAIKCGMKKNSDITPTV